MGGEEVDIASTGVVEKETTRLVETGRDRSDPRYRPATDATGRKSQSELRRSKAVEILT